MASQHSEGNQTFKLGMRKEVIFGEKGKLSWEWGVNWELLILGGWLSMHLCITLCFSEKKVLAAENTWKQHKAVACVFKGIKAVAIHFSSDNEEFYSLFQNYQV